MEKDKWVIDKTELYAVSITNKYKFADIYENLRQELPGYNYDQYKLYPIKEINSWQKYFFYRLDKIKNNSEYLLFYEKINNQSCLLACKIPKWDEEHFGFKMATIEFIFCPQTIVESQTFRNLISLCLNYLKSKEVKFISARICGDMLKSIHILQLEGFKYYENIIWTVAENPKIETGNECGVRLLKESDIEALIEIARDNQFIKGHLYSDINFDKKLVDEMYVKWLKTAWNNKKNIAVLEYKSEIAGFFIFSVNEELSSFFGYTYGRINLFCLKSELRGKGLGIKLFTGTMQIMNGMAIEYVDSGYSSKNFVSSKLHSKNQFYPVYEEVTLHLWL